MPIIFLWQKEDFLVFQEQFDLFPATSERVSCPAQPLLQLIRMSAHLLSQFYQGESHRPIVPRKPPHSIIRAVERNKA
jgi:hypothetical protein